MTDKLTSETSLKAISAFGCLFLSGWSCKATFRWKPKKKKKEKFLIIHMWERKREWRFDRTIIKPLPTKFMVSFANGICSCIFFHLWEPNIKKRIQKMQPSFTSNKKGWIQELTPRMQYQSMKVVLWGFERGLWTHVAERVEMEQISITNLALESDSCPIWECGDDNWWW